VQSTQQLKNELENINLEEKLALIKNNTIQVDQ
jgi:hypothetical protein